MLVMLVNDIQSNKRVHRARRGSQNQPGTNTQGKRGLAEMLASLMPNTYYSRPRFRYPFYHGDGKETVLIRSLPASDTDHFLS